VRVTRAPPAAGLAGVGSPCSIHPSPSRHRICAPRAAHSPSLPLVPLLVTRAGRSAPVAPILTATAMAVYELQEDEDIHNCADPIPSCIVSSTSRIVSTPPPPLASPGAAVFAGGGGAVLRSTVGARRPRASVEGAGAPVHSTPPPPLLRRSRSPTLRSR
jgi:hypothetical protein